MPQPQKRAQANFTLSAAEQLSFRRPAPFLKWAGGKTQLLPVFDQHIPQQFNRYYEPFVGGGAMFYHMFARKPGLTASLADLNNELINCYTCVRDHVDTVIEVLKQHRNEESYFYDLRSIDTSTLSDEERAARLIFLNKTCFNGLYRVNSRGQFNVPFGKYKNPRTCDEDNLRAVSAALQNVSFQTSHFKKTLRTARRDDFVYLDPPYQPLSATSNFTSYTSTCFGESDQEELAQTVKDLDRRGCKFMLSNSDNAFVRALYSDFRMETVYAIRAINCRGDKRGKITELLVMNY